MSDLVELLEPRLFFARGAATASIVRAVGQDAEFALGVREYDARLATPANERFVKAFAAKGAKMVSTHLKLAQETQGKLK